MLNPLEAVAGWATEAEPRPEPPHTPRPDSFDIGDFIVKHGLEVRREGPWNGAGRKWELAECPFNPEHTGGCAVITQSADGKLGYKCQHHSCIDKHWRDLRELFEPRAQRTVQVAAAPPANPLVMGIGAIMQVEATAPEMLIEEFLPTPGCVLMFGREKVGKTLLAIQAGFCVAANLHLFQNYRIVKPGPVLLVEADDPGGAASLKLLLGKTDLPVMQAPFFTVAEPDLRLSDGFLQWLRHEIKARALKLVILDSYTALRGPRAAGGDIVKTEAGEMGELDKLGKEMGMCILLIHHESKGAAGLDWSSRAAGSFAMSAAVEGMIAVARYSDLEMNSPERHVRIRGRHFEDREMVLRFRPQYLNFEHVLSGSAAGMYPHVLTISRTFGKRTFSPKEYVLETGMSRQNATRLLGRLASAGALRKVGYGEYSLEIGL
jgi:hypothetical protein